MTYLADRKYRDENREVRQAMLNGHSFALTVVQTGMFEYEKLLENGGYEGYGTRSSVQLT